MLDVMDFFDRFMHTIVKRGTGISETVDPCRNLTNTKFHGEDIGKRTAILMQQTIRRTHPFWQHLAQDVSYFLARFPTVAKIKGLPVCVHLASSWLRFKH